MLFAKILVETSRRHQTWVTNRGQLLTIEGRWQDGTIVLSGSYPAEAGEHGLVRGIWRQLPDGVRETAVKSTDNGKTWKPWFDLTFRRRRNHAEASPDAEVVSRLDKEYQAAVKINDATTMDRILADDFVLITGAGKKYTKTDLLAEARSGRTRYEQQDELEQ
jgi:Domain of unknown function (DUF4440)